MTTRFITLLLGAAMLATGLPALPAGDAAGNPGIEAQALPCEQDPFCPREDWKEEFERLCAQTDVATALEAVQLQQLVRDADELLPRLETLPRDQARLYGFRLKSCRAFFVYALQLLERREGG